MDKSLADRILGKIPIWTINLRSDLVDSRLVLVVTLLENLSEAKINEEVNSRLEKINQSIKDAISS